MMHRKELWAILIVIFAATGILVYTAIHAIQQVLSLGSTASISALSDIDISSWETYSNPALGFSISYPPNWQISTSGLSGSNPFVALGNPLTGTTTYVMQIFIEQNPQALSSGAYVHALLAADKAQDSANEKTGPAPIITPQFKKTYITMINGSEGYELFGVFEFDHSAERIYVAHENGAIRFDFPVADANSNLASPANNNAIAHLISNTLVW